MALGTFVSDHGLHGASKPDLIAFRTRSNKVEQ